MLNAEIRANSDYQKFTFADDGGIGEIGERMQKKLDALNKVFPDFNGKTVLDIGCDFGFWSFYASDKGAKVTGLDRSRNVSGVGHVDIPQLNNEITKKYEIHKECSFCPYEAGIQWHNFGKYDVVLLMSLYHHIFQNTGGDHESIWYWLWRHTGETLIWENPTSNLDRVVQLNVSEWLHPLYTEEKIKAAATKYFHFAYKGPALHEPHRVVWKLKPRKIPARVYAGKVVDGAGGASKAFRYNHNQRMNEIELKLGFYPYPGSLNIMLDEDFDWDDGYYRTLLLDVWDRSQGIDSEWRPKIMRFYPVSINGTEAHVMRFEGERYPLNMVELISAERLRDVISSDDIEIIKE